MNAVIERLPEPSQVGLSEVAHFKLESLVAQKHFEEMRDGFRFAVAYALAREPNPPRVDGSRKTIFSVSTLDSDQYLRLAVECVRQDSEEPTYRLIERLADWGIVQIAKRIEEDFESVADVLSEILGEA